MECSICFEILGTRTQKEAKLLGLGRGRQTQTQTHNQGQEQDHNNDQNKSDDKSHKSGGLLSQLFKKSSTDDVSCTPCGHIFHKRCIKAWIRKGGRCRHCPICRKFIQSESDLRTVFLNFLTETCVGCAEWKKKFRKFEQIHHEQCLHYSKELENALEEIKKTIDVNGKLTVAYAEIRSQFETERERASDEAKELQKRYEVLLNDFQTLQQKHCDLLRSQSQETDKEKVDDDEVFALLSSCKDKNIIPETSSSHANKDKPNSKRKMFLSLPKILKLLCFVEL